MRKSRTLLLSYLTIMGTGVVQVEVVVVAVSKVEWEVEMFV